MGVHEAGWLSGRFAADGSSDGPDRGAYTAYVLGTELTVDFEMGDHEIETKMLLAKLKELEREEGEIEVLEQENRESNCQDSEEGEINAEEVKIHGEDSEVKGGEGAEAQGRNSGSVSGVIGLVRADGGSREENKGNGIIGDGRLNPKKEEDAEIVSTTGVAQVQAFECFIGDENGASSDMEIEEDIPSPHLRGTHVSTYFAKESMSPLVVGAVDSQLYKEGNDNNSADSMLKRKRLPDLGSNPVIQVSYDGLPRESKKKLQEALHHWCHWHSRRFLSGSGACKEPLESGSDVYSPALDLEAVGNGSVSVWMDRPLKQGRKSEAEDVYGSATQEKAEEEVPLYDRACVSALSSQEAVDRSDGFVAIEAEESSRCFNCGAYTHSLLNCPRPRDTNAINAARKMHLEKKGGLTRGRTPMRYYQSSPGGKFDDIKPGALGNETRQSLGIGELDPPPWLHRMRELGYPPGYLEHAEDEYSEVEIFGGFGDEVGDDNGKRQAEDGEIVEKKKTGDEHTLVKKMTVQFPGINAPIPENADKRLWTSPLEAPSIQGHRGVKRNSLQQLVGGGGEIGNIQHSFSWSVSTSDPSSRDECAPGINSVHSTQWTRHGSSSAQGILNSPLDPLDGWKRRDGEMSIGIRTSGRETQLALPSPTALGSEHPSRSMFRAPGVGEILTTLPTPHIYSRQYHPHPPRLSLPIPNNPNEAWLKAQAALGVLQTDQKPGNSSSQQQWGRR